MMLAPAALVAIVLAIPAATALKPPSAGHARQAISWTTRVVTTTGGGFLIGNPAARAKLIEYGSLSCPYCQRFYLESHAALDARIATGDVSFEFRPLGVHSADPILHALLRCAGPANFRRFVDDFMQDQARLTADWAAWSQAEPKTDPNATAATRIDYSHRWGFTGFAMAHGVPRARVGPCLANAKAIRAQAGYEAEGDKLGVEGTPAFLINGKLIDAGRWSEVDQAIDAALR